MAEIQPDVVYRTPEGIIGGGPASAAQPNRCRAMSISIAPSAVVAQPRASNRRQASARDRTSVPTRR